MQSALWYKGTMFTTQHMLHAIWTLLPGLILVTGLLGGTGCSTTAVKGYRMHSKGMEPSIPAGTPLTIDEKVYKTASPKRHDFVGFRPSCVTMDVFVFRVVALPGESIKLTPKGLWVDGKAFRHPKGIKYTSGSRSDITLKLKKDEYFLLGDNHAMAIDSRHLGPAHKINILGKILGVSN